ncbi:hypothetical protein [Alloalcanivorax marinus]|uniref:hypothetical protein n=1 Tax=Alloalcanivorax marinus TaxID=1177169 RepID=UPI0021D188D3|nr:hypothetical protein [Alloalcanivorax marinus]MCU5785931.1 hypothetical protein [Alloalcanivorax marinus]
MRQWLREGCVLVRQDIADGRSDWHDRMEAREQGLGKVPDDNSADFAIWRCLSDGGFVARLGAILGLLQTNASWVDDVIGDLGLDSPLVSDNAGLSSQMYGGIWGDLIQELLINGADDADALVTELGWVQEGLRQEVLEFWRGVLGHDGNADPSPAEIYKRAARRRVDPDTHGWYCMTLLLANLNRLKHNLEAARSNVESPDPQIAAWQETQRLDRPFLEGLARGLSEGKLISGGREARFLRFDHLREARCFKKNGEVFTYPYNRL